MVVSYNRYDLTLKMSVTSMRIDMYLFYLVVATSFYSHNILSALIFHIAFSLSSFSVMNQLYKLLFHELNISEQLFKCLALAKGTKTELN